MLCEKALILWWIIQFNPSNSFRSFSLKKKKLYLNLEKKRNALLWIDFLFYYYFILVNIPISYLTVNYAKTELIRTNEKQQIQRWSLKHVPIVEYFTFTYNLFDIFFSVYCLEFVSNSINIKSRKLILKNLLFCKAFIVHKTKKKTCTIWSFYKKLNSQLKFTT